MILADPSPAPTPDVIVHVVGAWGTVPEWVAAVGTSAAFIVAAIALLIEARTRRAAQARRVFAIRRSERTSKSGDEIHGWSTGIDTWSAGPLGLESRSSGVYQGYLVSAKATVRCDIRIHNGSDEIIGPVLVRVLGSDVKQPGLALGAYIVNPHEDAITHLLYEWVNSPTDPYYDLEIAFRDSSGRWWTREENQPIKAVRKSRAAEYETTARKLIDGDTR